MTEIEELQTATVNLDNLLLGLLVMVLCLILQAVLVVAALHFYGRYHKLARNMSFVGMLLVLTGVMLMLLLGNVAQVVLWGLLFMALGEFSDHAVAMYHSAVNFATLGYGDIVMSEQHRLLGPLQAINGVLMIGVSTAVVMSTLQQLLKLMRTEDDPT